MTDMRLERPVPRRYKSTMRKRGMGAEEMGAIMAKSMTPKEAHEILPGNWGEGPSAETTKA